MKQRRLVHSITIVPKVSRRLELNKAIRSIHYDKQPSASLNQVHFFIVVENNFLCSQHKIQIMQKMELHTIAE
ncbi:hypothetical protein RUM44_011771 [Polyplax serrata]|uniref:Uncharacterized protein n=1 Tax=Polyplax serrata TaxID=468196 RepID=A0ABR1AR08_POLSC